MWVISVHGQLFWLSAKELIEDCIVSGIIDIKKTKKKAFGMLRKIVEIINSVLVTTNLFS